NGSGTTLHRAIFDSHPDLAIPGESRFVIDLARNRDRYETAQGFDSERFLSDLAAHKRFDNWGIPVERVGATLNSTVVDNYPEAIRCVYRAYAESQGKTRYGDKTQSYIHDLPLLAELFPEARVVHAVRDGRNVALAHAKGKRMEQVGVSWSRRVMAGRQAGTALGPDRYLESRYEDLIDDTEGAVRRICDFLDLPFDPAMLEYYTRAESVIATTAVPNRHLDIYKPPTKGLQDWQRDLNDGQVARFEAIAGHALEALGYQRAFATVPLGGRLAAWANLGVDVVRLTTKRLARRIGLG
ncbi:MAG TPA: sulfotransferase, partial [Acidimicrobiia bacterium]|nr:sulfotransferase [Acidimicrobiia bacterium]